MVGGINELCLAVHANLHAVVDRRPSGSEHQDRGGLVCFADQLDNCLARARRIDVLDIDLAAQLWEEAEQPFDRNGIAAVEGAFRA
ncbi:hypothetical protein AWV80_04505 [Cupriavidus sp. UYMU48A]|nr:hypothetical protein AWV80_04505 [Cupriavidus sp. UYMU48A]